MLYILEGHNGAGKTTLAKKIQEATGARVYRPLRERATQHLDDGSADSLRAMGIPANTYVDDVFAIDACHALGTLRVVLDRSMASAIGYGLATGEVANRDQARQLICYWARRVHQYVLDVGMVVYVRLETDEARGKERSGGRWPDAATQAACDWAFEECEDRLRQLAILVVRADMDKVGFGNFLGDLGAVGLLPQRGSIP